MISHKELGVGRASFYSAEEKSKANQCYGQLYSKTWSDWIDRICSEMIDCEIAFDAEMISVFDLSNKLRDVWHRILYGIGHAAQTNQEAEITFFLVWLAGRFENTFPIWCNNWIISRYAEYWHPYEIKDLDLTDSP